MNKFNSLLFAAFIAISFAACKKDSDEPVIVVPPSDGSTLTLNGLIGAEAGSAAGNSVYVDFSADKQTAVDRDSWDLGFYAGADFKVILNASNGSSAIVVNKSDLNSVTAADFDPNALKVGQGLGTFSLIDDPREANIINKTAIAAISATDAENKVYIINRKGGAATVLANDELYKIRVLRKGSGYTLQYAKVTETTFKTLDITKNADANFQFASLVKGNTVSVEPAKASWDVVWGYSMYYTATFPYAFSDLVFINSLAGVSAAAVSTTVKAYAAFAESDLATVTFSSSRDVIGSTWRTSPGQNGTGGGVKTDIFYLVKDGSGNVYKLKFNSFISNDGGTRGKPVIEYKLIKKG
ncbi:HmuY family protein [Pedobacter rhizosphaerae]|uniref:HmuY protein n=1 Tax=Pedobacter rhizosphaerae TaxID=390241 RepID=A0A1H9MCQ1_9SPHI|nr:HmuY family protein [Pedobacter rhizosphaerae]SER21227.1 HmuY protein [Pedobacter rhizosphaerae]